MNTLVALCAVGAEKILGNEIKHLGYKLAGNAHGRVSFFGDDDALFRANLCLRTADRLYLQLASYSAYDFDQLYDGVYSIPWQDFLKKDSRIVVDKVRSYKSKLNSEHSIQGIVHKAIYSKLGDIWHISNLPETGEQSDIRVYVDENQVLILLDLSGLPLHKRGYRPSHTEAALRETLAAAMVKLSRYRGRGDFCDPFCGSGTIAIEAALAALNRAPGLYRNFAAEEWFFSEPGYWQSARSEAIAAEYSGDYHITASDIDPRAVQISRENAVRAGVEHLIDFRVADAAQFSQTTEGGVIVTNPPYGERLLDLQQAEELYRKFGAALSHNTGWALYLLSSDQEFERCFGKPADKRRKLYNGMIRCDLYMYYRESSKQQKGAAVK